MPLLFHCRGDNLCAVSGSRAWRMVLWLVAATGCAGAQLGRDEPHWLRVRTAHFTLYTDLEGDEARARAELLERLLAAYLELGWVHSGELPLQLNVIMFGRPSEFRRFVADDRVTGFFRSDVLFEPWAVLPASGGEAGLGILRHELTHHMASLAMQHQPPWLAEGLACYFETAHFDQDGNFVVGSVPLSLHEQLRRHGLVSLGSMLAANSGRLDGDSYPTAWLLVHYLMSERSEEFEDYQRSLARGKGHRDAWHEAFPRLTEGELEQVLRAYGELGQFANYTKAVNSARVTFTVQPLSRADELALEALLWESCDRCEADADARAAQAWTLALAGDPDQLQAATLRLLHTSAPDAATREQARALSERHPNEWLAWMALAWRSLETDPQLAADAAERAVALAPRQPHAHMLLALAHQRNGLTDDARREGAIARRLQPTSLGIVALHALLLAKLGDCSALADALATLRTIGHETLPGEELARFRALDEACRRAGAQ